MKTNGASKIDVHRPSFLHRSRSHMHEIRSGFVNTFQARSESPGQSDMISSTKRIEEETQPKYHPDHFYPVKLGELLVGRYKVGRKHSLPDSHGIENRTFNLHLIRSSLSLVMA